MKIHIDEITADIEAADFSTDAAALTFRAKMCSDYCARELFTYEGFLPRWSFKTQGEKQRFVRTWEQITLEARSLISQARALGAGAIKNRLVRGANGAMLPHPQMGDDLDDGLFDMSVATLRQTVARALENNAAVQDVAHDVRAARGDIADSEERTQNMIHQKFQEFEPTKDQVAYLAGKKTTRSINGKKAQAKANADPDIAEAKQRADDDMKRAVGRVRKYVLEHEKKNEKYNLLAICRTVCKEFTSLTTKKNALGKCSEYAPLEGWQGNPIQPDTLRKNYTAKFGTKKAQKSQDRMETKTSAKSKVKRTTK